MNTENNTAVISISEYDYLREIKKAFEEKTPVIRICKIGAFSGSDELVYGAENLEKSIQDVINSKDAKLKQLNTDYDLLKKDFINSSTLLMHSEGAFNMAIAKIKDSKRKSSSLAFAMFVIGGILGGFLFYGMLIFFAV